MISRFRDENKWLSNMTLVNITYEGIDYPSVEHAYVSAKSKDMVWKSKCANKHISSYKIKKEGQQIVIRDDWDEIKLKVMEECLILKFQQEPFKTLLKNTGNQIIQEGNDWGDIFWGVDLKTGKGENHLGKLIMKIRKKL